MSRHQSFERAVADNYEPQALSTTIGGGLAAATCRADNARRRLLGGTASAIVLIAMAGIGRRATAQSRYPLTIAALQEAREKETNIYYQYVEYGRKAKQDGYRGIAYLFTAFATSELVHGQNFGKILSRLDVELMPIPKPSVAVAGTKENLLSAVNSELESIDAFYPTLLKKLRPENMEDAITNVTYAWESEKQHRSIIQQIRKWSDSFFERVAKSIDEKTGQYFVCQICGATSNFVPAEKCPICKLPSSQYKKIEPNGA